MPSTTVLSSGSNEVFTQNSDVIQRAGTRLWLATSSGTVTPAGAPGAGTHLYYSDNDGDTWTYHSQFNSNPRVPSLKTYRLSDGVWRLACIQTANNASSGDMTFRQIHTNVDSGTPGSLTTAISLNTGGSNAGSMQASLMVTETATNPRIWVADKRTIGASSFTTRIIYCAAGTAADTLTNWVRSTSTTAPSFGALTTGANTQGRRASMASWTISGNPRIVIVSENGFTNYQSWTFDPSAATPTLPSAVAIATLPNAASTEGPQMSVSAAADRAVFVCRAANSTSELNWRIYTSTDGASWTLHGTTISAMRAQVHNDDTDFYILYSTGNNPNTLAVATAMKWRKLTWSGLALSAETVFSDTNGNNCALVVGGGNLYGMYRADTAANYRVLTDRVSILSNVSLSRTAAVTVTRSDSATRTRSSGRAAADTVTRTDVSTRASVGFSRAAADAITRADSATRIRSSARSASDTVGRTDAATRTTGRALTASDSVATTDSSTLTRGVNRQASDTIARTDAAAAERGTSRDADDAVVVTDSAARSAQSRIRSAADSVVRSDVATRISARARAAADAITRSDSAAVTGRGFVRAASDTVTRSDTAAGIRGTGREAFDTLSRSDSAARGVMARVRSATDSVALSDFASRLSSRARQAADSISRTDSADAGAVGKTRLADDTVATTDAATTGLRGSLRQAADALGATDFATRAAQAAVRLAANILSVDGSAGVTRSTQASASDTLPQTDSADAAVVRPRLASDSVAVASAVALAARSSDRWAGDGVSIEDYAEAYNGALRDAEDTVFLTDRATARTQGVQLRERRSGYVVSHGPGYIGGERIRGRIVVSEPVLPGEHTDRGHIVQPHTGRLEDS